MIAAWAASVTDAEVRRFLKEIPGLGVVLYARQYHLADEFPAIAYCPTPETAMRAFRFPFRGMILGRDEPNVKGEGPSGPRIPPEQSRRQFEYALELVHEHPAWKVPASLAGDGSWWQALLFLSKFDDEYQDARNVPGVSWTASRARMREVKRVHAKYGSPHLINPALFRSWPGRCLQVSPRRFIRFSKSNPGVHIAIWSLKEVDAPHQPFGLFGAGGEITRVGEAVRAALHE